MNCPACGRPVQYGAPNCGACGADLRAYWQQAQAMGGGAGLAPQAVPPPPAAQPSGFKDFLVFRRMITPVIIQIIFWLGLLGVLIASFVAMGEEPVAGILALFFGPIIWRVYCEILILIFRMNESLTDIRNNTARR